jgi:hypothetical protein
MLDPRSSPSANIQTDIPAGASFIERAPATFLPRRWKRRGHFNAPLTYDFSDRTAPRRGTPQLDRVASNREPGITLKPPIIAPSSIVGLRLSEEMRISPEGGGLLERGKGCEIARCVRGAFIESAAGDSTGRWSGVRTTTGKFQAAGGAPSRYSTRQPLRPYREGGR